LVTVKEHGLFDSRDGGQGWTCVNGDLPLGAATRLRGLVLDPTAPRHIVVAADGSVTKDAGVYATRDGGKTWQRTSVGLDVGNIQCLTADPQDFGVLYLGARELFDRQADPPVMRPGGVFRSRDHGRTWEQILAYHFVSTVVVHPRDNRRLYVGTTDHPYHDDDRAEGVLRSTNGGATWTRENGGLSLPQVSFLRIDPRDPSVLYAGTGGNSVFIGHDR